jgi:DNA-directed RNA polymerase specialized sigma24 family protein
MPFPPNTSTVWPTPYNVNPGPYTDPMDNPPPPPHPFEALAHLATDPDPVQRALTLGKALDAAPDLTSWLRQARQQAVNQLRTQGLSYDQIGKLLSLSRARVQHIATGRPSGRQRAATEQPAAPDTPA